MTTWREAITAEMDRNKESWWDVVETVPADRAFFERSADSRPSTDAFTVWTKTRTYFPTCTACASVARHPDGSVTSPIGKSPEEQEIK